jgi:cell division protein FtsL
VKFVRFPFAYRLGVGFFVVFLFMVWEHVEAERCERQLKGMSQEADRLTYENGRMQAQVHQWISPSHLETLARKELKMAPVDAAHVIGMDQP